MTEFQQLHFLFLLASVVLSWALPRAWQLVGVSACCILLIGIHAPAALGLFLLSSTLTYLAIKVGVSRPAFLIVGVAYVGSQVLIVREIQGLLAEQDIDIDIVLFVGMSSKLHLLVVGAAYYSCRQIHLLIEEWRGAPRPAFESYVYYMTFLPVMLTGPINRFNEFQREISRRRWNSELVSKGIERVIIGYFKVVFIGNYLIGEELANEFLDSAQTDFMDYWIRAVFHWVHLYIQFSGWSDVAIGSASAMGLRVSENFRYPIFSRSTVEFWTRWHISLSNWCRDYAYKPILAVSRRPYLAALGAMGVMGIWHELSWYYLLWGSYHGLGIIGCRAFQNANSNPIQSLRRWRGWPIVAWAMTMNFIVFGTALLDFVFKK